VEEEEAGGNLTPTESHGQSARFAERAGASFRWRLDKRLELAVMLKTSRWAGLAIGFRDLARNLAPTTTLGRLPRRPRFQPGADAKPCLLENNTLFGLSLTRRCRYRANEVIDRCAEVGQTPHRPGGNVANSENFIPRPAT
jgi:hypothetical protein